MELVHSLPLITHSNFKGFSRKRKHFSHTGTDTRRNSDGCGRPAATPKGHGEKHWRQWKDPILNEVTKNNGKKIFSNKRDAVLLSYVTRSEAESLLEEI